MLLCADQKVRDEVLQELLLTMSDRAAVERWADSVMGAGLGMAEKKEMRKAVIQ
jgi:hypothetical protein